jgi:HD superfamily phosphohydrolase
MPQNELEHALTPYLTTQIPDTPEEILAILQRHNAPWTCGEGAIEAIDKDARATSIPDFCTGEESVFEPPLPHLERIPFLYRLHSLHQLSTVTLTTHFGARHSRLSHSVGAVAIAKLMIDSLLERNFDDKSEVVIEAYAELRDEVVQKACLAYCAFHDAFHGPFGHSLDIMKDVFGAKHSEKLDDKYFREGLLAALSSDPNPVGRQLRLAAELWVGPRQAQALLELILLLSRKAELLRQKPHLHFLHQIVNSHVDADRLDYVIRDGLYLEAKDFGNSYRALINSIRIVEWPRPNGQSADDEHPSEPPRACLAFASKGEDAAAELLGKRRDYYTLYYEKAEKLVVDDMICHALSHVLDNKNIPDTPPPGKEEIIGNIRRNLMMLTDESFIPALFDMKASPECYDLIFRFLQRQYYEIITVASVRLDEVLDTKNAVKLWVDEVEEFLKQKAKAAGVQYAAKLDSEDDIQEATSAFSSAFQRAVASSSSPVPNLERKILSFGFQYWVQSVFRERQRFEMRVWKRLMQHGQYEDELNVAAESEYGDAAQSARFHLRPPIHVTTSSFFAMLDKRDVLLQRKEGQPAEDLLFYELDDLDCVEEHSVTPHAKEDRPAYPLVLSAMPTIIREIGAAAIERAFWDELYTFDWLTGRFS